MTGERDKQWVEPECPLCESSPGERYVSDGGLDRCPDDDCPVETFRGEDVGRTIEHETLERALETWGLDVQVDKTEEELAELLVALKGNNVAAVIEELADVRIMVEQLTLEFGEENVQAVIDQKMERLADRIEDAVTYDAARVHRCGGCERVYGDPHVVDKGQQKAELCPHCGTSVQNEETEVRTVAF